MNTILTLSIIASIFFISGCSNKEEKEKQAVTTTSKKELPSIDGVMQDKPKEDKQQQDKIFNVTSIQGITSQVTTSSFHIDISETKQPIVLINIFDMQSDPSKGMIPYLDDMQRLFKGELFVFGLPLDDNIDSQELKDFMEKYDARYFISNAHENIALAKELIKNSKISDAKKIPLTIIYKNGSYSRHYTGATPIEMIQSDINQLLSSKE